MASTELVKQFSLLSITMPCSFSCLHYSYRPSIISTSGMNRMKMRNSGALILCCADSNGSSSSPAMNVTTTSPPLVRKRKRYRKLYPGENKGITEEMRFVAMRLRNVRGKKVTKNALDSSTDDEEEGGDDGNLASDGDSNGGESWQPSLAGFLKYLVDSKLVFNTVERIVDDSSDVSYAYFRKTGLERTERISKDLEWFSKQGNVIPEPSAPGVTYAKYLQELSEKSAPLFLCHFYNIYFSHMAGGQVIARQVSDKLLEGKDLEFYTWEGDLPDLMQGVQEKLNMLGEHWSRDKKNRCLREAMKSFRYLGQIVRLIVL